MKHFSGEQDKLEALAAQCGGAKSIEKRNKAFEGNDIRGAEAIKRFKRHSNEARKVPIEMDEKINSDKRTIEELQTMSKSLEEQVQNAKRENKVKMKVCKDN